MARRTRWLWLALLVPAGVGYQIFVHAVIVGNRTAPLGIVLGFAAGTIHAAINLTLLWVFARTLRPGREPLITGFARKIHGALPAPIETYTRRVTVLWCIFFVAELVISAVLLTLSVESWSLFVNVLTLPLVAAVFIAEYIYRVIRFRDFAHASIWDGVRAFADEARARRTHG